MTPPENPTLSVPSEVMGAVESAIRRTNDAFCYRIDKDWVAIQAAIFIAAFQAYESATNKQPPAAKQEGV